MRFLKEDRGNSAVEFGLILPLLMILLFAIIKFSVALNNNINLIEGVRVGVRYLAGARGALTTTPYATTVLYVKKSAANLNPNNITVIASVDGTPCTDVTAITCAAALATDGGTTTSHAGPVMVTAIYPCDLKVLNIDFAPNCKLSASTSIMVQ